MLFRGVQHPPHWTFSSVKGLLEFWGNQLLESRGLSHRASSQLHPQIYTGDGDAVKGCLLRWEVSENELY